MNMQDAVVSVFSQYAGFSGRARRSEYWMFTLFQIVVTAVCGCIAKFTSLGTFLESVFSLAIFIPGLALSVRRMHDINKSGWAILINLIPFIGQIIWFVWLCTEGNHGSNMYGPDPKGYDVY